MTGEIVQVTDDVFIGSLKTTVIDLVMLTLASLSAGSVEETNGLMQTVVNEEENGRGTRSFPSTSFAAVMVN